MIRVFSDFVQGSDEWKAARCGLLTASEMHLIITPTLKMANNDRTRSHVYELMAQRLTNNVEPSYISDDMLRGWEDEVEAKRLYAEQYAPIEDVAFVTNDKWGFTIGCSPDAVVGNDGLLECKSRRQKFQAEVICNMAIPDEHMIQVQTLLLVTEREWCDYVSYCGGMPMVTIRAYSLPDVQAAILKAATQFEERLLDTIAVYHDRMTTHDRLIPTESRVEMEITL